MGKLKISGNDKTITVRVPIAIRKHGGRKFVIVPDGSSAEAAAPKHRVDDAVVKAIARAFRWQELLENGTYATIAEIAEAEKINETYVGRILRLTLLAPEFVEAAAQARSHTVHLSDLLKPFPVDWRNQRQCWAHF
jgi:hypothetical protein